MVVKSVCSVGEETVDDGGNVGPDRFSVGYFCCRRWMAAQMIPAEYPCWW